MRPLPNEILSNILDAATYVKAAFRLNTSDATTWSLRRDGHSPPVPTRRELLSSISRSINTARKIVLVCKLWHTVGIIFLFRCVIVHFNPWKPKNIFVDTLLSPKHPAQLTIQKHGRLVRRLDVEYVLRDSDNNLLCRRTQLWTALARFAARCPNLKVVTTGLKGEYDVDAFDEFWADVLVRNSRSLRWASSSYSSSLPPKLTSSVSKLQEAQHLRYLHFSPSIALEGDPTDELSTLPDLEHYSYIGRAKTVHFPSLKYLSLDYTVDGTPALFHQDASFIGLHAPQITDLNLQIARFDPESPLPPGFCLSIQNGICSLPNLGVRSPGQMLPLLLTALAEPLSHTKLRTVGFYTTRRSHQYRYGLYCLTQASFLTLIDFTGKIKVTRFVDARDTRDIRKHARRFVYYKEAYAERGVRLEGWVGWRGCGMR